MKLTLEHRIDDPLISDLYRIYMSACGPLRTQAAARHVLSFEEFAADMTDDQIDKYVVWDSVGPVALATLTTNLSVISWISAEYFCSRYPDAAARGALYYLGYILVDESHRRSNALILMTDLINRTIATSQGVLGFDICRHNDRHGIGRHARKLLSDSNHIDPIDTQSYYAADYRGS